jgi:hypothetical protein
VIATLAGTIGTGRSIAWASWTYREACRRDRPNALVSMSVACAIAQPWASRSNAAFKRWALSAPVDRDIGHKDITAYAESQATTTSGTALRVARTRSYLLRLWRGPAPLLANIPLHQLDCELARRGHRFARYADDLVILVRSARAGERVMRSITRYLHASLKLNANPAKSKVAPMSDCNFLSFTIRGNKIRWTDQALADFRHRVRELTGRSWGVAMEYRLQKLGQYARGWMGYFGISQYYRPIPLLEDWIRRRVRMCYWKQWRWARTKIRHLLDLGVSLKTAIQHGVSSKSYWHMARTPALQQALSNAWLTAHGLVSVKALWSKAQGYTT